MNTGILFDLDGTLWDAAANITDSWNAVLKKHGYDLRLTTTQLEQQMGKMMEDIGDSLFPMIEQDARYALVQECLDYENDYLSLHGGNLFEGVRETFQALRENYQVMIVSNGQKDYVKTFIDYFDLWPLVTDYEEAGRTGLTKDKNIRLVMERNRLEHAIYVGDTAWDKQAADAAGVPFVFAAYGFGAVPDAQVQIDNIRELPEVVKTMEQ